MIDPREFRRTIGLFGTGVTVLASGEGDELRAMTANAVTSLSLEPMLLIACIHKKARIVANLNKGWGFSVNILRQEQQPLSNYFAGAWHEDEPPHFDFVPMDGGPRLVGCSASIGCRLNELLPGGDHWIAIGEVVALYKMIQTQDPLIFYNGRYRNLASDPEYEIPAVWDFGW